jgi:CelD/BcsL family acetyltransferase involved in cellulose biosynthesis
MTGIIDVIPPLSPLALVRRAVETLPFPLGEPSCLLFSRARHALWFGLQALGLEPGDEVLVPAYHHGSEVEAIARCHLVPRFYPVDEKLEPDVAALAASVGPRTKALHLTHFAGYPQDGLRWREWADARGLLLIEDTAQAWLGRVGDTPLGAYGDMSIFCLYKMLPVPDGAAVWFRDRVVRPPPMQNAEPGVRTTMRKNLSWLLSRSQLLGTAAARRPRRETRYDAAADFALGNPWSAPSSATEVLLPRLADPSVVDRRERNYRELQRRLGRLVLPPFDELPAAASPFGLPLRTAEKASMLDRLAAAGIRGLDFWRVPHPLLRVDEFPFERELRATTVVVPVHQELRANDVSAIARAARLRKHANGPRVDAVDDFDSVAGEWDALAPLTKNVFVTRDWLQTWWHHFGNDQRLAIARCTYSRNREVFALLPLYEYASRPVRIVRLLGHGHSDELGPICDPHAVAEAAGCLRMFLCRLKCDVFLGDDLRADGGWHETVGGHVYRTAESPLIRFPVGRWPAYLASRSANFREQARRRERALVRSGRVKFRLADESSLATDLDALFALHRARWGDASEFVAAEPFHRDVAVRALARRWLRLWMLEINGEAVAAWYGFRYAGIDSYYQAGRDPAWDRASVGWVLLLHTIRDAATAGSSEYRLLRGGEHYKTRFATETEQTQSLVVAVTERGRLAKGAFLAARRWSGGRAAASMAKRALAPRM